MIYKFIIRPLLFLLEPETAHHLIFAIVSRLTFLYPFFKLFYSPNDKNQDVELGGLTFRNRFGIAAGLDKDATALRFFFTIGFSHIEVGTVTPKPQDGNPKPRLFRLVKESALINRMGFNNAGMDTVKNNIQLARKYIKNNFIIGVNIGKNKDTPLEKAYEDYNTCLEKLYDEADYFTVNISSPNTEGLRALQTDEYLEKLLSEINKKNIEVALSKKIKPKNIFLKIAPDLTDKEIEHILILAVKYDLSGIVATNTTLSRDRLSEDTEETGGLSGKPLKDRSNQVLKKFNDLNSDTPFGKLILIGVGGVFNKNDYKEQLIDGADLIQVYTGYIYEGNSILKKILND